MVQASSLPVHRCFTWSGRVYTVLEHLPDVFLEVKCLMSFDTHESRWIHCDYEPERFNGYCMVEPMEALYKLSLL